MVKYLNFMAFHLIFGKKNYLTKIVKKIKFSGISPLIFGKEK